MVRNAVAIKKLKLSLALLLLMTAVTGCIHFTSGTISDNYWKTLIEGREPFDFAVATNNHAMYRMLSDSKLFSAVYQIKTLDAGTTLNEKLSDGSLVVLKPLHADPTDRPLLYFEGPAAASVFDWSTIAFFPYNFAVCLPNLFTGGLVLPQYVAHTYRQEIRLVDAYGNELAEYTADYGEYWVGWFMYLSFETDDEPHVLGGTDRQILRSFFEDYDAGKFGDLLGGGGAEPEPSETPTFEPFEPVEEPEEVEPEPAEPEESEPEPEEPVKPDEEPLKPVQPK